MTKKIGFFIIVLLLGACKGKQDKMILEGMAPESKSGEYVYLYNSEMRMLIDSAQIRNGEFSFTTDVKEPAIYHLTTSFSVVNFIAENEKLFVDLTKDDTRYVCGSMLNDELATFLKKRNDIRKEFDSEMKSVLEDPTLSIEQENTKKMEIKSTFDAKSETLFNEYFSKHQDDMLGRFLRYTSEMQKGIVAETGIESAGVASEPDNSSSQSSNRSNYRQGSPEVGSHFVNFTGIDSKNPPQEVDLAKYLRKGNYVIVHIWASFCGPCRAEVPFLAKIYKKYRSKGLEIVGVGTDVKLNTHIKWMKELDMPWPQIFDNDGKVPEVFGVDPTHLYIYDGDGKVIAKAIPGKDLEAFVRDLYKK